MNNKRIFLAIISLGVACISLNAQMLTSGSGPLNILAPQWEMGVSADFAGEFSIPADISSDLGGDLGVYSTSETVKFQGAYSNKHFLTLSLNYTYSYYDFSSDTAPFSSMNETSALAFYLTRFNERWGAFAIVGASLGSQIGESMWDGRTIMGAFGATYSFCKDFTVGFGGMAYSRLDNTWIGLPIAYVDWNITNNLKLRTFSGVALLYDFFGDNTLILNAVAEYRNTYYRLAEESGNRRSVGDSFFQISVGATYNITDRAYISAAIGGNINRELNMRRNSNSAEEYDIDSAPFFSIHAGMSF